MLLGPIWMHCSRLGSNFDEAQVLSSVTESYVDFLCPKDLNNWKVH